MIKILSLLSGVYAWLRRLLFYRTIDAPVTDIIEYEDQSKDIYTHQPVQPGDLAGIPMKYIGKARRAGKVIDANKKYLFVKCTHLNGRIIKISKQKARKLNIHKAA